MTKKTEANNFRPIPAAKLMRCEGRCRRRYPANELGPGGICRSCHKRVFDEQLDRWAIESSCAS